MRSAADAKPTFDDPSTLIDEAIRAHGGAEQISQADKGRVEMEVEGNFIPGFNTKGVVTDIFQRPDKQRRTATFKLENEVAELCYVLDGKHVWMQANNKEPFEIPTTGNPITQPVLDNLDLLIAVKNSDANLTVLPETELRGQTLIGIRAELSEKSQGDLYFNRKTHLLAASKKSLFNNADFKEHSVETSYTDYTTINGLAVPMTIEALLDGKPYMKVKVLKIEFLESISPETFSKPKAEMSKSSD